MVAEALDTDGKTLQKWILKKRDRIILKCDNNNLNQTQNTDLFTLKTLIWHAAACSLFSVPSPCKYVSTWIRNGTPFSPPCFFGVNSVLMQFTWMKLTIWITKKHMTVWSEKSVEQQYFLTCLQSDNIIGLSTTAYLHCSDSQCCFQPHPNFYNSWTSRLLCT